MVSKMNTISCVAICACLNASASAGESTGMTSSVTMACADPVAVGVQNVTSRSEAILELRRSAMEECPAGYDQLGESVEMGGKKITWPIRCHREKSAAPTCGKSN